MTQQSPIKVHYREQLVGNYVADLLVEDKVLVELKAAQSLEEIHIAQCLNYLKATKHPICMLLNFGRSELQFRRISARKEWKAETETNNS